MSMVVRTNVMALNSHRALKNVGTEQNKASAKLSSGYRINSAADDASGLAISEKMRAQIRGLDQASTNSQNAISLIQTAEGGMNEIDNMVQRIRELVVNASNDTNDYDTDDLQKIQDEIDQLIEEIDSMSERVEFNSKKLINGTYSTTSSTALHFQVGANASQSLTLNIGGMGAQKLGLKNTSGVVAITVNQSGAGAVNTLLLTTLDTALTFVTTERSKLGAAQNRLEYTIKSLDISSENLSSAESLIRDTDMAKEMMNLTAANVLQSAATSMLAQANSAPQSILQLLQ